MQTREYRVSLEMFGGPMDLLLYLVRRNEVDILELPLANERRIRPGGTFRHRHHLLACAPQGQQKWPASLSRKTGPILLPRGFRLQTIPRKDRLKRYARRFYKIVQTV